MREARVPPLTAIWGGARGRRRRAVVGMRRSVRSLSRCWNWAEPWIGHVASEYADLVVAKRLDGRPAEPSSVMRRRWTTAESACCCDGDTCPPSAVVRCVYQTTRACTVSQTTPVGLRHAQATDDRRHQRTLGQIVADGRLPVLCASDRRRPRFGTSPVALACSGERIGGMASHPLATSRRRARRCRRRAVADSSSSARSARRCSG